MPTNWTVADRGARGRLAVRMRGRDLLLVRLRGHPRWTSTQMAFNVDDIEAEMAELRNRGVVFEKYGIPGLPMVDGIVDIPGTIRARAVASAAPGSVTAKAT